MALLFLRRSITSTSIVNVPVLCRVRNLCSQALIILDKENEEMESVIDADRDIVSSSRASASYLSQLHLSPLFPAGRSHMGGFEIELVDPDTWRVSSGLAQAWRTIGTLEAKPTLTETVCEPVNCSLPYEDEPDFDEIEDMRIRGNLFYKLDRDSREFEEYNFSFRRKKSSKICKEKMKASKSKENPNHDSASGGEKIPKLVKSRHSIPPVEDLGNSCVGKKLRSPTFNQLTDPYHEPFCLDIYLSKSSVRACIVHRVTSKVVAVAHSISKDMKFDLVSTKDSTACATVGGILAQRALADDIYDVVYTPRRGEKLEGKLQIVLQSVIDHGINVKVKIKQRRAKKQLRGQY